MEYILYLWQSPGKGNRLPEVFCVVSGLDAFAFYGKLLDHVEKRRISSSEHAEELLQAAYGKPLPDPGEEVWIQVTVRHGGIQNNSKNIFFLFSTQFDLEYSVCNIQKGISQKNVWEGFTRKTFY